MKEEILFTSIKHVCDCTDGWFSIEDIKQKLMPLDRPVHLKFQDENYGSGSVFVGNMDYFDKCPAGRRFKISLAETKETLMAKKLYGYSII